MRPLLIALGGRTGAGKTTLAYALRKTVPFLETALVVGDDEVRRELLGYGLSENMPPESYENAVSARVRNEIKTRMHQAFRQGRSVINHAGFYDPESQRAIHALAADENVGWIGLWLDAPEEVLIARVEKRLETRAKAIGLSLEQGHASDACLGVLLGKFKNMRPLDSVGWQTLDAKEPMENVIEQALAHLTHLFISRAPQPLLP